MTNTEIKEEIKEKPANKKEKPKKEKEKVLKDKNLIKELNENIQNLNMKLFAQEIEFKKLQQDYVKKANEMAKKAQLTLDEKINSYKENFDEKLKESKRYAIEKSAAEFINAVEVFDSALSTESNDPAVNAYQQGFKMIYSMFITALENSGVKEIKVNIGDKFDPIEHDALEAKEENSNKIIKVFKKGYRLHERVIQPVSVALG